jgi:hypothetical protein
MADQFNAFSLDPLQLEQDQIAQQMRMAEAAALRRGTGRGPSQFDIGNDVVLDTAANIAQGVTMPSLRHRQEDLSQQFEQSFESATSGAPDQIKALIKNPATRPQGMQLLLQYNQDEMDKISGNDPSRFVTSPGQNSALPGATAAAGGSATPGGRQYDINAIQRGLASNNPKTKAMAENAYKEYIRQIDPDKLQNSPDGGYYSPAQVEAQQLKARQTAAQQAVNAGTEERHLPGGKIGYVPKTDPSFPTNQVLGIPGQSQAQIQQGQALPGAVAASQPPQGPAPQQRPMAQAPVPAGPGMAQGSSMQVPPQVQMQREAQAFDMLQGELNKAVQTNDLPTANQLAVELKTRFPNGRPGGPAGPGAPPQVPAQQAPTAASPAEAPIDVSMRPKGDVKAGFESYIDPKMKIQMPPSQYANPGAEKAYYDRINENHATLAKLEGTSQPGNMTRMVEEMEDLLHKPHLSGKAAAVWRGVMEIPPHADEATANTIRLNMLAQGLAGIKTRAVQNTQISDFDFKVGQMQVPSVEMPLEGQLAIMKSLKSESQYLEGLSAAVRQGVHNNIPANEAARAYSTWYRDALKYNEGLQNPTSAPAGSSPAVGRSQAAPFEYKEPGTFGQLKGFLGDKTAYGDMAKALPGTIAGIATNPGAWGDALADKGRGVANFFGQGDREDAVKRAREHEARAAQDPQGYGAGYNFAGTVPETIGFTAAGPELAALKGVRGALDLAKVAAPSIARTTAVGAASGASRPEESWGQQAKNSTFGAAAGLAGSLLPAALPATRIAAGAGGRAMEDILSEFPRLRSTLSRSQINPGTANNTFVGGVPTVRAAQQVQAVSDDIAVKAGLKPGPLSAEKIGTVRDATNKEVEGILTSGSPTKVDSMDKQFYKSAVTSNPEIDKVMSKSPVLKFVQETLASNSGATFKPGAAISIWKEVQTLGNSEAEKAVKQIVENMITRNMPGDVAKQFKALGERGATLNELSAAYGADTGKLGGSGYLTPTAIEKIGQQNPGGTMDRARRVLGQMNVGDVKKNSLPSMDLTDLKTLPLAARRLASPVASLFDTNMLGMPDSTKAIVNILRGGAQAGQPAVAQELYNAQK